MVWLGIANAFTCCVLFLAWMIANLLPRALSHHRWYLSEFPDYPKIAEHIYLLFCD